MEGAFRRESEDLAELNHVSVRVQRVAYQSSMESPFFLFRVHGAPVRVGDGSVVITRLGTSLRWACTGSTTIADTINAVEGGGESVTTGRGRIRDIQ